MEVGVLEKNARVTQGRTRQMVRPLLVSVQKKALLGLGQTSMIGSGGKLGSGGTVHIRRAAEVGKYMKYVRQGSRGNH